MAEVSAATVKQLRDRTGQGMMDCKKALIETNGDIEKAIDWLRKKGLSVLEKRGGQETKEGKVVGKISSDGKTAVLASLCTETDFTAKSQDFQDAAEALAQALLDAAKPPGCAKDLEQLNTQDGRKVSDVVSEIMSKTGEKVNLGDFARFDLEGTGLLHCYVHFNHKIGTILSIETDSQELAGHAAVRDMAGDLAMHVTAINPAAVSRDEVDQDLIAREKEIAAAQIKDKPANLIEKIVTGKMNKWFQQHVALEQPFVKDDSKTVSQLLEEVGRQVGGSVALRKFARVQIG